MNRNFLHEVTMEINKELKEKFEAFWDALPLDITHEFEDEYCEGQKYYSFAYNNPPEFLKSTIIFYISHKNNPIIQRAAHKRIGSDEIQTVIDMFSDEENGKKPTVQNSSLVQNN